ncbi:MAG TPA: 2-isopropylmalate synthase [Candidatus Borkfalkia excrementigallinarum]|uniref:2-isopropylmalate synthase n=1 Tax=Candidatus Borkfalkia excrementigallinarum TaxID=2838506 RepID=A0A9D1ZXM8_9FIRM|nr:2-isopropylmalate synthase [Candidatus Borkfalkia excrementigallinarum]
MKNYQKYTKQYFLPPVRCMDWAEKDSVDRAPVWCSVDLRDGNQALIEPMTLEQKVEFFKLLLKIGFKEIEVGFPAASDTEYTFLRTLIENNLIPDDVTVQVLTQAREHIIRKTFEAIEGAKNVIVHVYNSTSVAQREQVFKKDKAAILKIAVDGAKLLKQLTDEAGAKYRFEYSPESFTGTEPEYALEVCNAVLDVWQPTADRKAVINIPATVENAMPHVFAQQVEYISKNLKYRENVVLSLHPHNDRGCGVAATEMGLLAGADRVEGTLFGNGERTGNADVVSIAMNMFSQGVDPQLDFSFMPEICQKYTEYTQMDVSPRQPYAGALVFAAFSGSHQDAIAKGMQWRKEHKEPHWNVPYLPIDPQDVGREYQTDVIRINSQSGKGGVGFILQENYGLSLPAKFKEAMGYAAKGVSDRTHKELKPAEVYRVFVENFIENRAAFDVPECHFKQLPDGISAAVTVMEKGKTTVVSAEGNGRLDAVTNALKLHFGIDFVLTTYEQHAMSEKSDSQALSYVGLEKDGAHYWGAGVDEDIIQSSINALVSALNNYLVK